MAKVQKQWWPVGLAILLTFCVIYSPQPILPKLMADFAVGPAVVGTLMTVTMIPLALAPVAYGYILQRVQPMTLLRVSLSVVGLGCFLFSVSGSFEQLLGVRLLQGIFIPAVMTSITTYIALSGASSGLRNRMAFYIACTIVGGFLGRFLSGLYTQWFDWAGFYSLLGAGLLFNAWLLRRAPLQQVEFSSQNTRLSGLQLVLQVVDVRRVLFSTFCLFFVFVALLNYLPYRLHELHKGYSSALTGAMYSSYLVGVVASLKAPGWATWLGGSKRLWSLSYLVLLGVLGSLFKLQGWGLFLALCVLCGAMFSIHAIASSQINLYCRGQSPLVNALYVAFYYGGGALGSYVPGLLYERWGWEAFLGFLVLVLIPGACWVSRLSVPEGEGHP